MYCRKCGFNLPEDAVECPFCHSKVNEEVKPQEQETQVVEERQQENNQNVSYNSNPFEQPRYSYLNTNPQPTQPVRVNETTMGVIRNNLGYVELKTKPWHHILIAICGYFGMEVLFTFLGAFLISISGIDLTCFREGTKCAVEVENTYMLITTITQVICELAVVGIMLIIFRKYLKVIGKEFKDKQTWRWFGIGFAILMGGTYLYSILLTVLQINTSDNANQEAVNNVIFNNPLLGLLFVVIAAPIFEEIVFRFGIFRAFTGKSKKLEIVGIIVTTAIFAGLHMVATFQEVFAEPGNPDFELLKNDMLSLPIYLIGAFALTFSYYKSKNIVSNIMLHMTNNAISFFAIIALPEIVEEVIPSIINIITRLLF